MIISLQPKKSRTETFLKKKAILKVRKEFDLYFLLSSSMTNLREQILRVQIIFWQGLFKL